MIVSIDAATVVPEGGTVTQVIDLSAGGERQRDYEALSVPIVSLHCPEDIVYSIKCDRGALCECMTRQRDGGNDVV